MARITKKMLDYQVELLNSKASERYALRQSSGGYGLFLVGGDSGLRTGNLGLDDVLTATNMYYYVRGLVQATFAVAEGREVLKTC